jgi:uncharacterized membrane protein
MSTGRLEALVDGVFAVVMTLLILTISVPREPAGLSHAALSKQLSHDLYALRFTLLAYAISFVIAGVYWVGHHNQFPAIQCTDRVLLWITVLFLLLVTGIPFSAALLGAYPDQQIAVVIYGGNLVAIGLVLYLQWWYATSGHRLTDQNLDPLLIRRAARRILMGPGAYLLAIALSFISTAGSIAIYALVPMLYILPGRVDRHLRAPVPGAAAAGGQQVGILVKEETEPG